MSIFEMNNKSEYFSLNSLRKIEKIYSIIT